MADIKDLGIFGHNKGLEKMKKDAEKKKQLADITEKKEELPLTAETILISEESTPLKVPKKQAAKLSGGKKRLVGAPVRKFDRVYAVKTPIKLSPLLNATSRILVEKYATNFLLILRLNHFVFTMNIAQADNLVKPCFAKNRRYYCTKSRQFLGGFCALFKERVYSTLFAIVRNSLSIGPLYSLIS